MKKMLEEFFEKKQITNRDFLNPYLCSIIIYPYLSFLRDQGQELISKLYDECYSSKKCPNRKCYPYPV